MKCLLLFLLLLAPAVQAQQVRRLTPDEAVEIGLQNSHALRLSREQANEASARVQETRTQRLPSLTGQAAYQRLSSNIPDFEASIPAFGSFPGGTVFSIPAVLNRYSTGVSVQQPLFTGYRIQNSIRMAEFQAEAALQDVSTAEAEVAWQIREAFWNVYKASTMQGVVTEALRAIDAHLADVTNMRKNGLATNSDVLAVETRRSEILLQRVEADNALRLARLNLNYTAGLPLDTEVEPVVDIVVAPEPVNTGELVTQALSRRTELAAVRSQIQALETSVRLVQAARLPQVAVVGNYRYARPNQMIFPIRDEFNGTWDAGLSISMDLWNWGRTRAQADQARARVMRGQEQLAQLNDAIRMDVTRRVLELNRATEALAVIEQSVRSSRESWRVARERFSQGMAITSEVLDAEVAYRNAETRYTAAMADYAIARAALERATATPR